MNTKLRFSVRFIKHNLVDIVVILLLLLLPYYLFDGKLYVGGDDTRLFYVYPAEYIKNIAFYSWNSFSSLGSHNPNQFSLPFLYLFWGISLFIKNIAIVDYFSFSLPLIVGFISFRLLVSELFKKTTKTVEQYLGALLYIASPLTIVHQISVFLITIYFFAVIPLIGYFFLRFIKTGRYRYVYSNIVVCIIFSLAFYAIPWMLGMLIPLAVAFIVCLFLSGKKVMLRVLRKTLIFLIFLGVSQLFWLTPFISSILIKANDSFVTNTLSGKLADTFSPTVLATATGNLIYPLLNLPLREIAFDFNWQIKDYFLHFYDYVFFLNTIFIVVIFLGIFFRNKLLIHQERIIFISLLAGLMTALAFYTVNIGPFKDFFLLLGKIPGFVMFRNFYDKFSIGYIFFYCLVFSYSLIIVTKHFIKCRFLIISLVLLLIIINALPIKGIINAPLWGTKDIYRNVTLSREYLGFLDKIKRKVPQTSTIMSLPLNIASYSIIKGEDKNSYYVGTSPITLLTGIKNLSGSLSFTSPYSSELKKYILQRDYARLNDLLRDQGVNYIILTKNLSPVALHSYLFDEEVLSKQDDQFLRAITGRELVRSSNSNFILYRSKSSETSPIVNNKLVKINQGKYLLSIPKVVKNQEIDFRDAYHSGWKLYRFSSQIKNSCNGSLFCTSSGWNELADISYLFDKPVFDNTHMVSKYGTNLWKISTEKPNTQFIIFFLPQVYFYIGLILSVLGISYLIFLSRKQI